LLLRPEGEETDIVSNKMSDLTSARAFIVPGT
jgi:hypothetical protein